MTGSGELPDMRVAHYSGLLQGGAAGAARRLHESLCSIDVASDFVCASTRPEDVRWIEDHGNHYHVAQWDSTHGQTWQDRSVHRWEQVVQCWEQVVHRWERARLKRGIKNRVGGRDIFTQPLAKKPTAIAASGAKGSQFSDRRIRHLHWVSRTIDLPSLIRSIPKTDPVVWTLHDMNPLTGGCHFSAGCKQFATGCGQCPQLRDSGPDDASRRIFEIKHLAVRERSMRVIAPSKWLVQQARQSGMFSPDTVFDHIPYSVDTQAFAPIPRDQARSGLGLPIDQKVIAFGAMGVDNPRKGARELVAAISKMRDRSDLTVLVFGDGHLPVKHASFAKVLHVGRVKDRDTLRQVYSAADVFALPSLEDNLPLTGLEAMSCGTAIIGFDAGGIPDYVHDDSGPYGRTGMTVATGDVTMLSAAFDVALADPNRPRLWGHAARRCMESDYAMPLEAERYARVYREIWSAGDAERRVSHSSRSAAA